jgi:hypothetical protein
MSNTYQNAPQSVLDVALPKLRGFGVQLRALKAGGRYALSMDLSPEARPVIEEAIAYCDELAAEIGVDTFLGAGGTPAEHRRQFERDLERVRD